MCEKRRSQCQVQKRVVGKYLQQEKGEGDVFSLGRSVPNPSSSGKRSVELCIGKFWVAASEDTARKMNEGWRGHGNREVRIISLPGDRKESRLQRRGEERGRMREGTEGRHCSKIAGALSARVR